MGKATHSWKEHKLQEGGCNGDPATVMSRVVHNSVFQINRTEMEAALSPDMLATDLAYYLVRKGVSSV